jgi:hypothetical protein
MIREVGTTHRLSIRAGKADYPPSTPMRLEMVRSVWQSPAMTDSNPDAAAIAEFHAAAHRRQVRIMFITSMICLALGVLVLVVAVTAGSTIDDSTGDYTRWSAYRADLKVILLGVGFLVAGVGAGVHGMGMRKQAPPS